MTKVNQQLIADQLNISQTTVSRSFSNHPSINPETKSLVLEAAAKLGYRATPSRTRKRNASKGLTTIGVLIGMPGPSKDITDSFQYVLRGITERTSAEDIVLDILYQHPRDIDEQNLPRNVRSARWKGAVLVYPFPDPVVYALSNRVSCVSIVENYRKSHIDSIDVDREWGIFKIVEHLKSLGHNRIGFINRRYFCTDKSEWALKRFGAYVQALYSMDLDFNPEWCLNVKASNNIPPEEIPVKAAELMKNSGITAWVCAADHQAYFLINAFEKMGIGVPQDCSITGFDGVAPPTGASELCTVKVPYVEMGSTAINQLIRRMEQPSAPRRHIMVDGIFFPGETTGPCKKR